MSGDRRSATRGTDTRKFSTTLSRPSKALYRRACFGSFLTSLTKALVLSSIISVSMSLHSVFRQSANWVSTRELTSQTSLMTRMSFSTSPRAIMVPSMISANSNMSASL